MGSLNNAAPPRGRWVTMALAGLLGTGLLSACDEKPRPPAIPQAASSDTVAHARRVAEEQVSSVLRSPAAIQFRGVQVYQQADARVVAVCGQVNPTGRDDQPFIPFVSVVTYARRPDAGMPAFDIDQFVANSTSEATRMYIEMTSRCGENGGPRQVGNRQVIPPLPPLPSDLPDQIGGTQPARTPHGQPAGQFVLAPAPAPAAGTPAEPVAAPASGGTVTMRQAGNIRNAPVSGSQLVRVAPRGAVLRVFAQAPGGWLQVGEGEPEGWVHSSLVDSP
jgi:hypothetical protein